MAKKKPTYLRGAEIVASTFRGASRAMSKRAREMRREIVAAGVRTFSDTGQTQAYVEWGDGSRTTGDPENLHMQELLRRAEREGVRVKYGEVF